MDFLTRMDSEILLASALQRRHVLRVPIEWFGYTIPFDEMLKRDPTGVQLVDCVLETTEDCLRRPSRIESLKALALDFFNERWCRALPRFDTSHFELVVAGGLLGVLRRRTDVTLALRDERDPVVMRFVLESRPSRSSSSTDDGDGLLNTGSFRGSDITESAVSDYPS